MMASPTLPLEDFQVPRPMAGISSPFLNFRLSISFFLKIKTNSRQKKGFYPILAPRVVFFHHFLQMCSIQVHVDLGGGNAFVAQHLLNGPEVGAMFQEMGGEGMSEGVRADLLTDPALFGQLFYQGEDHGPGEAGPATVEKQGILKSFLYRCMHPYLIPVDIYVL